ncbi:MAG: SGNH/GDSL hydrolase family protein [Proteobacteria bacterium]|nr:SGNH/GDSL hydrolase family protein [Pseudomonadota bacterium]
MLESLKQKLINGEPVLYVAFGDSITEGYGVSEGWPEKLVKELKKKYSSADIKLINKGRAGDTVEDGLFRLDNDVIENKPDFVSINFGINDAMSAVPLAVFEKNLNEMINIIKSKTQAEILAISSEILEDEEADKTVRKYYDKIQKVSREQKIAFVDIHRYWHQKIREGVDINSLLIPGLDHPNEEGYKLFAKIIADIF